MDLYADDIFFKIFKPEDINLTDFFLSWIHKPEIGATEKIRWTNAGNLISASFAIANLKRHIQSGSRRRRGSRQMRQDEQCAAQRFTQIREAAAVD